MYIEQIQLENLRRLAAPGKVAVIYGARRTGKTTLLKEFLKGTDVPNLLVSGEDIAVQGYLSSRSVEKLKAFIGTASMLVVDEAQKVPDIGHNGSGISRKSCLPTSIKTSLNWTGSAIPPRSAACFN
jgi:AAA+ ATPase superfamily predicted ATPase